MEPYLCDSYGNPSSLYPLGRQSKQAIVRAENQIAEALHCQEYDIVFTSGGTESDNMALVGAYQLGLQEGKRHIITSSIEHPAVLNTCKALQEAGAEVTYLPVSPEGFISPADLEAAIRPDTVLVSIMHANNEIGTIQDITTLAYIAHKHGALFHTDAVQTIGHIPINMKHLDVDLLSFSAHKSHGPKGVGGLIHRVKDLPPLLHGGGQQNGMRSGTENVPGIVGCGEALYVADLIMEPENRRINTMTKDLMDKLLELPGVTMNGPLNRRLPGNINISIDGVEGEAVVLWLGQKGICVSAGSACAAGSLHGSHVLNAIGTKSTGAVRITLGRDNMTDDVNQIADAVKEVIEVLR